MRRRLIASTALIALAAVLLLGTPLALIGAARVREDELFRLEREADDLAAVAAAGDLDRGRPLRRAKLAAGLPRGHAAIVAMGGRSVAIGRPPAHALRARSGASQGARATVWAPAGEVAQDQRSLWLGVVGLAGLGVTAAVGLAALQARRLLGPLERLTATSARLGAGDFSARAGSFDVPELARVGAALDGAAEEIARLVGRQREFAANASHQLRSPLTALRLRLEEIAGGSAPEAMRAKAASALAVAERLEATVRELLDHARAGHAGAVVELDLAALAREHAAAWRALFELSGRELVVTGEARRRVRAPVAALAQALDVLLDNALHHGAGTTSVTVACPGGRPSLAVEDEGPGVPHALMRDIFAPAVSTAGSTGLGLPLARALVEAAGGQLVLAAARPPRFEIVLPSGDAPGSARRAPRDLAPGAT
jgi:signal transduction histidine kinase